MSRFFAVENSYQLVSIRGYDWTAGQAENPSSEDGNQRSAAYVQGYGAPRKSEVGEKWDKTELVRPVVSIERGSLDPPGTLSSRPATLNQSQRSEAFSQHSTILRLLISLRAT
jgi:hypothetical protein